MNKQPDYNTLVEKYPLLFSHSEESQEPFAHFGFECDIGWYNIISKMCETIYSEHRSASIMIKDTNKRLNQFPDRPDLLELKEKYEKALEKAAKRIPKVAQLKEKFGTLRVYVDGGCNTARGIVEMAENMSEVTCEVCGCPGKTYTMGWHKTLCYEHAIERYTKNAVDEYNKEENE